jgi:hypothetical protein
MDHLTVVPRVSRSIRRSFSSRSAIRVMPLGRPALLGDLVHARRMLRRRLQPQQDFELCQREIGGGLETSSRTAWMTGSSAAG